MVCFFTLEVIKFEVIKLPYRMFLRKILGRFLTTIPEKQELSSQQQLKVSTEPEQQLELIPVTSSIQQYPQQMVLPPCDEFHFHPPNQLQQLNQSQVPYP